MVTNTLAIVRIVYKAISHIEIHLIFAITVGGKQDTYYYPHLREEEKIEAQTSRMTCLSPLSGADTFLESGASLRGSSVFNRD